MSNLTRFGSQDHYTVYDGNDIVGYIDKTMLTAIERDEDASVFVTLPCGHETRFWAHYFTDEQYIDAANRLKKLDDEDKAIKED